MTAKMDSLLEQVDEYTWEQLELEQEWRRCFPQFSTTSAKGPKIALEGFKYFCRTYWTIKHPERGRIPFDLFEAQETAVFDWLRVRYSIVMKARQIGFSTLLAAFAFWLAFGYSDRPILMLSRTQREAIKLLSKAKYGYQGLPDWMKDRGPPLNQTQMKMEFANGSYIESFPSNDNPARGESAYLIICDEFAFIPNQEEAWAAIEPVADVGGRVILLSTARGEGNVFHRLWVGSQNATNRFKSQFFDWSSNGRTQDWYDNLDLDDWQLAQEYPSNPEEAFLKSGNPVFDLRMLKRREEECRDPIAVGRITHDLEFVEGDGSLEIWEWPVERGRYAMGVDVAKGLEHGDFSSVHVVNARTFSVVAHWHGHTDPDLLASDILAPLGRFFNSALIGAESNQHGLTTLKTLERLRYYPIYTERNTRYKSGGKHAKPTEQLGFYTTQKSKPLIIDGLAEALRDDRMNLWSKETFAELKTYVRVGDSTVKMEGSPFDDRVISLALANYMTKFVFFSQYQVEDIPPPGTVGGWERRLYGESFSELVRRKAPARSGSIHRMPIGAYNVRGGKRPPRAMSNS